MWRKICNSHLAMDKGGVQMAAQPKYMGDIEREAVYRIREMFPYGREAAFVGAQNKEEEEFLFELSRLALYPEKPLLSFSEEEEDLAEKWDPSQDNRSFFRMTAKIPSGRRVQRLIACGGVDDGKSTLIGRILYDTMSREEQEAIHADPKFLRRDQSVDYALLAGATEEEARQGITVQVSYSLFQWEDCSFLMADVPGHEEYTHNMAFAAAGADTAVIMIGANKGIVPQTRRHTRICYFMGIRNMIFAVNKMDMVSFDEKIFMQLSGEINQMMEEYQNCSVDVIPVAAKSGVNMIKNAEEMSWHEGAALLDALKKPKRRKSYEGDFFCMPVQRTCKSSQMKDAAVKKRVIQGEIISGSIKAGNEIFVSPTGRRAKAAGIYILDQKAHRAAAGTPVGIELDRELDVGRGYILTGGDDLAVSDRIEADILWTSDNRLTQGKRYQAVVGTTAVTAVVTKIHYQVDVTTGEHSYAEYLTKNALARCEICFSKQIALTCEGKNRRLGTIRLLERKTEEPAAYGNIVHTISEESWKEDGKDVTCLEREAALGQKGGVILFSEGAKTGMYMNYTERYLLRMGFHTIQILSEESLKKRLPCIRTCLNAGLILLLALPASQKEEVLALSEEKGRFFDAMESADLSENMEMVLKQIKIWALELI